MKRIRRYNCIWLLLCAAMLLAVLSGCGAGASPEEVPDTDASGETEAPSDGDIVEPAAEKGHNVAFTLRYTSEDTINPIYSDTVYNDALMSLMYEGLFRLDGSFRAEPVLCSEYESEDGILWRFSLITAQMHDGSDLKAVDVVYSINLARNSTKYASRLKEIAACYSDDDGRVVIELFKVNRALPTLLDVPIICAGSGDENAPAGTGPYYFKKQGNGAVLMAFDAYRNAADISQKYLFLKEFPDDSVEESFSDRSLDIICETGSDTRSLQLYGEYEVRFCDTTLFQYIGFNYNRIALCDPNIRQAIACAVDRAAIADGIYDGNARPASLLYNPAYYLYEDTWGDAPGFSISEMSAHLAAAGLLDHDNDGLLEYNYGYSSEYWETLTLRFLVFEGSEKKVAAAEAIAANLNRVGLDVQVRAVPWQTYLDTLSRGAYELYYAEAALPHDFDFSALLTTGGAMNYGGCGGSAYAALIQDVKEAEDEDALRDAAAALCSAAAEDMPIVPVLYRQNTIYTHRGELVGLSPSVSGVFQSVKDWTIVLS